jgi:hypothetical protein
MIKNFVKQELLFALKSKQLFLIIISAYSFILPSFGQYDLKNVSQSLAGRIFDFLGAVSLNQTMKQSAVLPSLVLLFVIFVIAFVSDIIITKKRSSFI